MANFNRAFATYGKNQYPLTEELFPQTPDMEEVKQGLRKIFPNAGWVENVDVVEQEAMPGFGLPKLVIFYNSDFSVQVVYSEKG